MDLQTLIANARRKLDETTPKFWTDADLTDYANQANRRYWQWMIKAQHPESLSAVFRDITSDVEAVPLPTDFLAIRLVERVFDSFTRPLKYRERWDISNGTKSTTSDTLYLPEYRMQGTDLVLEPTPQVTVTNGIKIIYYRSSTDLVNNTDTPDIPILYHDMIADYMVIQAKRKEESVGGAGTNVASWVASLAEQEQDYKETIEKSSYQRDYVQPFNYWS